MHQSEHDHRQGSEFVFQYHLGTFTETVQAGDTLRWTMCRKLRLLCYHATAPVGSHIFLRYLATVTSIFFDLRKYVNLRGVLVRQAIEFVCCEAGLCSNWTRTCARPRSLLLRGVQVQPEIEFVSREEDLSTLSPSVPASLCSSSVSGCLLPFPVSCWCVLVSTGRHGSLHRKVGG